MSPDGEQCSRSSDAIPESHEWVMMKSLIDAHEQTMKAMEHQALSSLQDECKTDTQTLRTQLEQTKVCYERAIEDVEMALDSISE